jgi:voltage-gated potassium channel
MKEKNDARTVRDLVRRLMTAASPQAQPRGQFPLLSRRQRRRKLIITFIRAFLGATVLFVLYYRLPLDRSFDADTVIALIIGLIVVAGAVALQVRSIIKSHYPRLRAIGALATTIPLFILLFATTYYLIAQGQASSFNAPMTRTDSLYFTVTVFSTVGFGDIVPVSQGARVVAMVQMVGDLVLLGIIGKVILGAVSVGLQRSADAESAVAGDAGNP